MSNATVIGIDLAKNSLQLHGVDARGKVVLRKSMRRNRIVSFFANYPSCLVVMEACATSAYWARAIEECGHEVRRIHPKFVTPYRLSDKNDANDAAAICEAAQRPHMRFVPRKSQAQSDIQSIHRVRSRFIQSRTAVVNQIRGLLGENGITVRKGIRHIRTTLTAIVDDYDNGLSEIMRTLLRSQYDMLVLCDDKIDELDRTLVAIAQSNETCKSLMRIPGIGYRTATLLVAVCGDTTEFKNGREFAAYLGLVPRQHSTGGKQRLLGITKRGDSYARTMLIHGARAVYCAMSRKNSRLGERRKAWLTALAERRGTNKACVALANKTARIAWCVLAKGVEYNAEA